VLAARGAGVLTAYRGPEANQLVALILELKIKASSSGCCFAAQLAKHGLLAGDRTEMETLLDRFEKKQVKREVNRTNGRPQGSLLVTEGHYSCCLNFRFQT
jgi:hypothetical protein